MRNGLLNPGHGLGCLFLLTLQIIALAVQIIRLRNGSTRIGLNSRRSPINPGLGLKGGNAGAKFLHLGMLLRIPQQGLGQGGTGGFQRGGMTGSLLESMDNLLIQRLDLRLQIVVALNQVGPLAKVGRRFLFIIHSTSLALEPDQALIGRGQIFFQGLEFLPKHVLDITHHSSLHGLRETNGSLSVGVGQFDGLAGRGALHPDMDQVRARHAFNPRPLAELIKSERGTSRTQHLSHQVRRMHDIHQGGCCRLTVQPHLAILGRGEKSGGLIVHQPNRYGIASEEPGTNETGYAHHARRQKKPFPVVGQSFPHPAGIKRPSIGLAPLAHTLWDQVEVPTKTGIHAGDDCV